METIFKVSVGFVNERWQLYDILYTVGLKVDKGEKEGKEGIELWPIQFKVEIISTKTCKI